VTTEKLDMADLLNIAWMQQPIGEGWNIEPDPVVWISVVALDAAWRGCKDYIGPGGSGSLHVGRYGRFGEFFVHARSIIMPTLCLDDEGAVSFTNGRHRFAWLRDRGLSTLPIEIPVSQEDFFARRFGSSAGIGTIAPNAS
jgi:hypothetical protein